MVPTRLNFREEWAKFGHLLSALSAPDPLEPAKRRGTQPATVDARTLVEVTQPWSATGPKLWAELHAATGADAGWLAEFSRRIPCGDCRAHWAGWVGENPPDFGDGWYAWTVAAHNAVNARLGKGTWTGTSDSATPAGDIAADRAAIRLAICAECKPGGLPKGIMGQCQVCGCYIEAKARNRPNDCPRGFWPE